METNIPLYYVLLGLVLASALLTWLTHEPASTNALADSDRKKKSRHKKAKRQKHPHEWQPYLLEDGTLALSKKGPTSNAVPYPATEPTAAKWADPLPHLEKKLDEPLSNRGVKETYTGLV